MKLNNLQANKASGPDDISARILKEAATDLSLLLHIIFKRSIKSGEIPDDWRHANVVLILKAGDKAIAGNYRLWYAKSLRK